MINFEIIFDEEKRTETNKFLVLFVDSVKYYGTIVR